MLFHLAATTARHDNCFRVFKFNVSCLSTHSSGSRKVSITSQPPKAIFKPLHETSRKKLKTISPRNIFSPSFPRIQKGNTRWSFESRYIVVRGETPSTCFWSVLLNSRWWKRNGNVANLFLSHFTSLSTCHSVESEAARFDNSRLGNVKLLKAAPKGRSSST